MILKPLIDVLPLIGNDIVVNSGGGILNDIDVLGTIFRAIDWLKIGEADAPDGGKVTANLGEETVDFTGMAMDPDMSSAILDSMLDEAGYKGYPPITILFPESDERLGLAAEIIAEELSIWDIGAQVEAVPLSELEAQVIERRMAGMPTIA